MSARREPSLGARRLPWAWARPLTLLAVGVMTSHCGSPLDADWHGRTLDIKDAVFEVGEPVEFFKTVTVMRVLFGTRSNLCSDVGAGTRQARAGDAIFSLTMQREGGDPPPPLGLGRYSLGEFPTSSYTVDRVALKAWTTGESCAVAEDEALTGTVEIVDQWGTSSRTLALDVTFAGGQRLQGRISASECRELNLSRPATTLVLPPVKGPCGP